jgi:hypothetical protein
MLLTDARESDEEKFAWELARQLSLAYWSKPEKNDSADVPGGNAFVDSLPAHSLNLFFQYVRVGPTYCMVKRRVNEYSWLLQIMEG